MTITELERCVDVYGKDIYSFCRQITGNVWEGEDLYQDTFMKAVELLDRIAIDQNPKSYLLSVSIRLWKNRRRKYAWRQRIAGMESLNEMTDAGGISCDVGGKMPEEEVLLREQGRLLHQCIAELSEKYRIPVYLYYSAELSVKEIADCLKIPEGTVKSRLHKAKTVIKKRLEVAGYDK